MWGKQKTPNHSSRLPKIWHGPPARSFGAIKRQRVFAPNLRGSGLAGQAGSLPRPPLSTLTKQIILLAIMLTALLGILASNLFKIDSVNVEGAESLSSAEIAPLLPTGRNIWTVSLGGLERRLSSQFPQFEEVSVYKVLPREIKAVVLERQAALIWQNAKQTVAVDPQGIAFPPPDPIPDNLPRVMDSADVSVAPGQLVATPEVVQFVAEAKKRLNETANLEITNISFIETTFDAAFTTKDGWRVMLATDRSLEPQMGSLTKILAEKRGLIHEYVDLRVPGYAFVK